MYPETWPPSNTFQGVGLSRTLSITHVVIGKCWPNSEMTEHTHQHTSHLSLTQVTKTIIQTHNTTWISWSWNSSSASQQSQVCVWTLNTFQLSAVTSGLEPDAELFPPVEREKVRTCKPTPSLSLLHCLTHTRCQHPASLSLRSVCFDATDLPSDTNMAEWLSHEHEITDSCV